MPADESGRESTTQPSAPPSSGGAPPSSGGIPPSSSGPPPADYVAWGPVRDAITSIHNLETLLKSPRVAGRVLGEVIPEFLAGIDVLRGAFSASAATSKEERTREARTTLARFTLARLDELEAAMRTASRGPGELDARMRLGLEQVVTRVSVDLDAAAELLDLSERAEHATTTELSLDELTRVSLRGSSKAGRNEREIAVRLARRDREDTVLRADPHVLKRLIAFAVARAHALSPTGAPMGITIRAVPADDHARIEVSATRAADTSLPSTPTRLVRRIDVTDAIVDAAAAGAGIDARVTHDAIVMRVRRAP